MIGIFLIATGEPYVSYAKSLIKDIKKYFLTNHEKTIYLFTDAKEEIGGCVQIYKKKLVWPLPTLMRFHTITKYCEMQHISHPYFYYIDSDFKIAAPIGDEILGERVATLHPGFYRKTPNHFPLVTKFLSRAYVNPNKVKHYFCGGFQGGMEYLELAKLMVKDIDIDQRHGFCPEWHDENYWNATLFRHSPDVILPPAYCMPETNREKIAYGLTDIQPKMIAITKQNVIR